MSEYNKSYGTVNTDAERENILVDKVVERLSGKISGLADEAASKAVSGLDLGSIFEKIANRLGDQENRQPINVPKAKGAEHLLRGKVVGPGYQDEFADWRVAQEAYIKLKDRMLKARQPGTIKFYIENVDKPGKWEVSMQVKLNEDAFE